tara:strand:+ start:570 stop:689 length:120 start_codon:yes stop_codon:yes gene_type:complete
MRVHILNLTLSNQQMKHRNDEIIQKLNKRQSKKKLFMYF